MGSYFGTCLSLDDFNKNSVLANAYDANKAVVFLLDSNKKVLGRKLICISEEYKLIGYNSYIQAESSPEDDIRKIYLNAIEQYCYILAADSNLPLATVGEPENISGLFWYDDGIRLWDYYRPDIISKSSFDPKKSISAHFIGTPDNIFTALKQHESEILSILDKYSLLTELSDGKVDHLSDSPVLAEEILYVLAWKKMDSKLADILYNHALTESGKLLAITAKVLITKDIQFLKELVSYCKNSENMLDHCIQVLFQIGSADAHVIFLQLTSSSMYHSDISYWPSIFACRSKQDSEIFFKNYVNTQVDSGINLDELAFINEFCFQNGWHIPDSFILKTLKQLDHSKSSCMQFLPQFKTGINRKLLNEIKESNEEALYYDDQDITVFNLLLLIKNRGGINEDLLKEQSISSPGALLALSLKYGEKLCVFISKTVAKDSSSHAAILALMLSEGIKKASELLSPSTQNLPSQEKRIQDVKEVFKSFLAYDFSSYSKKKLRDCELFFITKIWTWIDIENPDMNAISSIAKQPTDFSKLMRDYKVYTIGVILRLVHIFSKVKGQHKKLCREACFSLISANYEKTRPFFLLFNKLSGNSLFPKNESNVLYDHYLFDNISYSPFYSDPYMLYFSKEKQLHPLVMKWFTRNEIPPAQLFSMDFDLAMKYTELLAEHFPKEELKSELNLPTMIQRIMLGNYLSTADKENSLSSKGK